METEKREFGKLNGHYQLYGNVTNKDYNMALCYLCNINPKTVKGLTDKE